MLPSAYLTDRQLEIWSLRLRGLSKAEIGRMLDITRQAVYDAENILLEKVELALTHAAESNMIEPQHVDATRGILLGFSPQTNQRVIITFSARNGVQTWHYQQPDCGLCRLVSSCRSRLIEEAEARGVELSADEMKLPPSELAQQIFESLIPEL
jgi:DNA-binding CsgD family transcriptional regulator